MQFREKSPKKTFSYICHQQLNHTGPSMMKTLFLLFLCLASGLSVPAQYDNTGHYVPDRIDLLSHKKLSVHVGGSGFFQNNEYFNDFQEGYTLTGYFLQPELEYYPAENIRLRGGIHLLQYSGSDSYAKAIPMFQFRYRLNDRATFIMGSLAGGLRHGLLQPLYKFERHFTGQPETGIQFLYGRKNIRTDTWINWEKFIEPGSYFQEVFTAGHSSAWTLTGNQDSYRLNIPLQVLFTHRGGQIDQSGKPVQTLGNLANGLEFGLLTGKRIREIGFRFYFLKYNDLSPAGQLLFESGHAFYPCFSLMTGTTQFLLGYWNATRFIAPRGEYMFQSVYYHNPVAGEASRELLTAGIQYHRILAEKVRINLRLGGWYDLVNRRFDYSMGVHLVFDESLLLKDYIPRSSICHLQGLDFQ